MSLKRLSGAETLRSSLFVLLVGLITYLSPSNRSSYEYKGFREGGIAPREVIAPATFTVLKNEMEYETEVESARRQVLPVVVVDANLSPGRMASMVLLLNDLARVAQATPPDSVIQRLKRAHMETGPISDASLRYLFHLSSTDPARLDTLRSAADRLLSRFYDQGILDQKDRITKEAFGEVRLQGEETERTLSLSELLDLDEATASLESVIRGRLPSASTTDVKALYEVLSAFLTPNFTYDAAETERRRDDATRTLTQIQGTVLRGERIVDQHDRVTASHIDQLSSLARHMNQRGEANPYLGSFSAAANTIVSALMVAVLFGFLKFSRPVIYRRTSNVVLFGILLLMPIGIAHYAATLPALSPLLVPVALSVMLATVLFDAETGLVVALVSAGLCASFVGIQEYSLVFLIAGIAGAFSVRQVHHRSDFYRSIVYLIVAYSLTISASAIMFYDYATVGDLFEQARMPLTMGVFAACASSVLTIGLLPIFESVFNVVTAITLLELSDLNRPLLRNLAIRAPGTYSHSIIMASLSEAAADAIGGDRLLARVGCYYHDIGKMIRPHYFIENQKGINPHDELQPRMSALILISHVKEGVELGREEGLPMVILDLIPQHHGTGEIASFKHRALERGDKQAVRDEDFQYSGPRPQTKVAGIINLADAVESATRTLSSNAPDQIKGMVQTIIKGRYNSGELDECDLTLRDLTNIQEAFLPILGATRHSRVLYPWQQEDRNETRDRRRDARERG